MKKAIIALSLVTAMVLGGVITVFAEPGPDMEDRPGYGMHLRGKHMGWWNNPALNLTDEQKAQLKAQFLAHRNEMAPIRYSMIQKRAELQALLAASTVDKAKVLAKQKELLTLQDTLAEKRLSFQIEQRQFLTPEQQVLAGPIRLHEGRFRGPR